MKKILIILILISSSTGFAVFNVTNQSDQKIDFRYGDKGTIGKEGPTYEMTRGRTVSIPHKKDNPRVGLNYRGQHAKRGGGSGSYPVPLKILDGEDVRIGINTKKQGNKTNVVLYIQSKAHKSNKNLTDYNKQCVYDNYLPSAKSCKIKTWEWSY